jgi:hypothetical protein
MDINSNKIRMQFDDFSLHFDRNFGWSKATGWSLFRDGRAVLSFVKWDEVWAAMTLGERVRLIVFGNSLR